MDTMKQNWHRICGSLWLLLVASLLVTVSACGSEATVDAPSSTSQALAMQQANDSLRALRGATARFHSTTQAEKAGYVDTEHCVEVPELGGMGYHWVNEASVDEVFDPLAPEALLYATGPGGKLKLVAVEYIVIDVGQAHPTFAGQPFDVGGTPLPIPHYSLHVWLWKDNPNGMFTPFNPDVTCP
jgi:hypothetical protein